MNRIDERQFLGARFCDEISNSEMMGIATVESSCFGYFAVGNEDDGLESVSCGLGNVLMNLATAIVEECNGEMWKWASISSH